MNKVSDAAIAFPLLMKVIYHEIGTGHGFKRLFKLMNDTDITPVPTPARYVGLRRLRPSRRPARGLRPGSKGFRQ